MQPLLSVRNLTTLFHMRRGLVRAIEDVTFDVMPAETVGIVGESGSGKSVTAHSILRLIAEPGRIARGEVWFEGRDLLTLSEDDLRQVRGRRIAMIFQNPRGSLNPLMTVGDQISRLCRLHLGHTRAAARERTLEMLNEVQIADPDRVARSYPHQLSGGMCQRVMIVMALICEPALIISDESTTGLDVTVQRQILHLMKRLRDRTGVAQIIISHDMGVIAHSCDRAIVMYAGKVAEVSPIADLFADALHPYSRRLIAAVPRIEQDRKPTAIPGDLPDPMAMPDGCRFRPRCASAMARCATVDPKLIGAGRHQVACHLYEERPGGPALADATVPS